MSFYAQAIQAILDEFKWDQNGYLVQPSDVHNQLWNLLSYLDFMHADIYGNSNGVITGLNITASSPTMTFAISSGRATALAGQKIIGLINPGVIGQPSTFTCAPANGVSMAGGQTRIDLICLQYTETAYQDTNTADHIVEGCSIVIIQGTPGTPGVAPTLPDGSYVAVGAVTIHAGDTTSGQAVIDTTAAGLRTNFPSLLSLLSIANSTNAVTLQGLVPVPQLGQGGVDNISVHGYVHSDQFIELPYITTPGASAANTVRMYYKSDGNRYIYDPVYGEQLDIPVGVPTLWLSSTLPSGCFWNDGSIFSTLTFPRLATITNGKFKTGGEGVNQDRLPDARGRTWFGPDSFGGNGVTTRLAGSALGATGGAQSIVQTLLQLAAHIHTDLNHSHGATDPGHGHGATSAAHAHGGPGGNFIISVGGGANTSLGGSLTIGDGGNVTAAAAAAVTINSAATGVTIANGQANIQSAGSNNSMNVMNPYICGTGWILRY